MLGIILNTIGILGVFLILLAYLLLEHGTLKSHQKSYLLLNIIGASCILFSLYSNWNLPSFVTQVMWIIIGIYGLYKEHKNKP